MYFAGELGPTPEKVIVNVPNEWFTRQLTEFLNGGEHDGQPVDIFHHMEREAGTPVYEYKGIPPGFGRKFYIVLDNEQAAVEWRLKHAS